MIEIVLAIGAFFAGLFKVGFGQGAGLLALPLYTLVVPAQFANGVLAPLLVLSDLFSIRAYWRQWQTRLLLIFLPGQLVGVLLGAYALAHLNEQAARRSIGVLLVLVVVLQIWARRSAAAADSDRAVPSRGMSERLPRGPNRSLTVAAPFVSLAAGFTSALAQIGTGLLAVYLVRLRTSKQSLVPTLNVTFLFSNIAKLMLYWHYGLVNKATWAADAWLVPSVLLGAIVGVAANRRLSQYAFETVVLAFALAAGAKLLVW